VSTERSGDALKTVDQKWIEPAFKGIEHNIHAVMDGTERAGERTMSLVRQYSGSTKVVLGDSYYGYFQVRLFSPTASFDAKYTAAAPGGGPHCLRVPQTPVPCPTCGAADVTLKHIPVCSSATCCARCCSCRQV
jgi:hypothetical protein